MDFDATIAGADTPADRRPDARPDRIGRYVILEILGAGGMGVVYQAYDPELDRKIAVKVLLPGTRQRDEERLVREARAMARVSHPNVVPVHDVGKFGEQVFVAMDFVDGQTLAKWLTTQRRGWRDVVAVFIEAGEGLSAAHEAGVTHRDFKPENVLIDGRGRPQVTDFGLALETSAAGSNDPESNEGTIGRLTRAGALVGTPAYMAPEQFEGAPVDARTDQFAFCVSLWEALYGERPFDGETLPQLVQSVTEGTPRRLSRRRDIPARLYPLLRRGLSRLPADRWPSMSELITRMRRSLTVRRRMLQLGAVAIASGVGAGAMAASQNAPEPCDGLEHDIDRAWNRELATTVRDAFLSTQRPHAATTADRVEAALDAYSTALVHAKREACEATHVRRVQSDTLMDLRMRCLERRRRELEVLVPILQTRGDAAIVDGAIEMLSALGDIDACADTEALVAVTPLPENASQREAVTAFADRLADARTLHRTGRLPDAVSVSDALVHDARALDYAPVLGEALLLAGLVRRTTGDLEAAFQLVREAATESAKGRNDRNVAEAASELVFIEQQRGRYPQALALVDIAKVAVARAGDSLHLRAKLLNSTGATRYMMSEYGAAEDAFAEAIELLGQGGVNEDLCRTYANLGAAREAQGRLEEAIADHRRAIELFEEFLGPEHPEVANALNNLGTALWKQGHLAEAEAAFERALALTRAAFGEGHPMVARIKANYALLLESRGDVVRAEAYFREAIATFAATLGDDHQEVAGPESNLGLLLTSLGRSDEAKPLHEDALRIFERAVGPASSQAVDARTNIAVTSSALGDHDAAYVAFERSLSHHRERLGPDHPRVGETLMYLATEALFIDHLDDAKRRIDAAVPILERALGREAPRYRESLLVKARVARRRGELDVALEAIRGASGTDGDDGTPVQVRVEHAQILLELGSTEDAADLTEAALVELARTSVSPTVAAEVSLGAARVRWARGDEAGAMTLAREADARLRKLPGAPTERREVQAWIREHER